MECTCGQETRDNAFICDTCLDTFTEALGDITWLNEELDVTIAKLKAAGDGGAPSAETALPYHVEASERRERLRAELVTLVRFCDEEGTRHRSPNDDLPPPELVAMSRWLLWRVDGLAFNDMAQVFIDRVTAAVTKCKQVIDRPPERKYAGPCPECGRDLYHRPNATDSKCVGCGQVYVVAEIQAWMRERIEDHLAGKLVTAHEGAMMLGRLGVETSVQVIYHWANGGRLEQVGADPKKRRLYRWDDLLDLAAIRAS